MLIVSQYFPPEPFRVGDLAVALREKGHDVTVLTGYPNYPKGTLYEGYRIRLVQREDYHGVRVVRVPLYPNTSYSKVKRSLNYISYAFFASLLGPFLCGKVDRIIVFQLSPVTVGVPGVILRFLKRAPLLFWIQDIWPDSLVDSGMTGNKRIVFVLQWLVTFLYKHSDRIVVQSKGFIARVMESNVPADHITYLPNWAEDLYRVVPPDHDLMACEGLQGYFNVIFAGNIGAAQGLDTLLVAAERLTGYDRIQFVVLGDGAKLSELQVEATRREIQNVKFLGRKPVDSMPAYFAAADALVVMLKRSPLFAITVPSKVQSYLACGRPLIAALEGSGAEVVAESGAGLVCEPEDPQALVDAVLSLYAMTVEERSRMAVSAREYYEYTFSRIRVMDQLDTILRDLGRKEGDTAR